MKIYLDAGHGGKDPGSIHPKTRQQEDRTNFNVMLMLAGMLTDIGYEVALSRKRHDEVVPLQDRMDYIRKAKPDVVVSIHHNASSAHNAAGGEVIAQVKKGQSTRLAESIGRYFEKTGQKMRPIVYKWNSNGTADYYGILRAAAEVGTPAVITEYAFIDNDADLARINTYQKQGEEAAALRDAIRAWWESK